MSRFLSPESSDSPSPTPSMEDIFSLPAEIAWISAAVAAASEAAASRSSTPSSSLDSTDSAVTLVTKALPTPTHSITGLGGSTTTNGQLKNDDSLTRAGAQAQDERRTRGVFGWDNGTSIAFFICLALLLVTIIVIIFFIIQRRKAKRNSFGRQQQYGNETFGLGLGRWSMVGRRRTRSGFTTRVERGEVNWVRSARDGELAVAQRRNVIFDEATGAVHSAYDMQTSEVDGEKKGFKAIVENLFSGLKTKSENGSQPAKEDKSRYGDSHSSSSSSSSPSSNRARSIAIPPPPFVYPNTTTTTITATKLEHKKSQSSGDRTVSTIHDENVAVVGFAARYDDDIMGIRPVVPPPLSSSNNGGDDYDDDAAEAPSVPRKPSAGRRSLRRGRSDSSRPATASNSSRHNSQRRPSTSSSAASFWKNSAAPIARSLSKSLRKEKRDIDAEIQEIEKEVDLKSESRRSRSRNAIPVSPLPRLPSPVTLQGDGNGAVLFAKQHGNGEGEGGLIPVYQRRPTPINVLDNIGNSSNNGGDNDEAGEEREKVMWARNHIKK